MLLKNMPGDSVDRTYDLCDTSPVLCQLIDAVSSVRVCDIRELNLGRQSKNFKVRRFDSSRGLACSVWIQIQSNTTNVILTHHVIPKHESTFRFIQIVSLCIDLYVYMPSYYSTYFELRLPV